jgi:AcrR family transcriptional regulator
MTGTEERIEQAFRELLNEKPFSGITVKNIIERCGVNRNTFYYHYESIPYLLGTIIKKDLDRLISEHYDFQDPLRCIEPIVEYAADKKRSIMHIYHSVERERFVEALQKASDYMAGQYVEAAFAGAPVNGSDRGLLSSFYASLMVGVLLGWLDKNMEGDLVTNIRRVNDILMRTGRKI